MGLLNGRSKDEAERLVVLPCFACLGRTPMWAAGQHIGPGGNEASSRARYSSWSQPASLPRLW
ncbi:MAG TPA: hypothetical protein VND68_14430 [Chloroflexia bacterium]|nr:hypothetical protein [Chloroflexia bacterium]